MTPTADPIWTVITAHIGYSDIGNISHDFAAGIGAVVAVKAVLGQYNGGI